MLWWRFLLQEVAMSKSSNKSHTKHPIIFGHPCSYRWYGIISTRAYIAVGLISSFISCWGNKVFAFELESWFGMCQPCSYRCSGVHDTRASIATGLTLSLTPITSCKTWKKSVSSIECLTDNPKVAWWGNLCLWVVIVRSQITRGLGGSSHRSQY